MKAIPPGLRDRVYDKIRDLGGFGLLSLLMSAAPLLIVGATGVALIVWSYPSIVVNGLNFLTTSNWDPKLNHAEIVVNGVPTLEGSSYGVLLFVTGTLLTSGIALLLSVPVGLGMAIFLTQIAPRKISAPISFLVELMAGIPSVVFGFWGIITLGPFLLETMEPFLANNFSFLPIFAGPVNSAGLLSAGIILALMVIPIVTSISRDVMSQTPAQLKDGARALGLTKWEVTRKIVLPNAKAGIVGAAVLGLGRALGESIAVAMVSGIGVQIFPRTLYYPVNTIAAQLAVSLNIAQQDPTGMNVSALMELAAVLLAITVAVNIVARLLVRQGFTSSSDTTIRL